MPAPPIRNLRFVPRAQPPGGIDVPGGDSLYAVPDIPTLEALDDTTVDDGGVVAVKSVLDLWMLDQASSLASDHITIADTNSGTGRWIRMLLPSLVWQLQADWYISESAGDDENDGNTAGTPLQTWAEYQRRIGEGPLEVDHTVTLLDTITTDIEVRATYVDSDHQMTIQGTRSSPLYSGSVTGKQAKDPATNTDLQITDAAIPVSWTASGLVEKLYVLTSGANAGACGWVCRDLGANTARITVAYNETAGTYVEPAIGDQFDVVDLGLVQGELHRIGAGLIRCEVRDLRIENPTDYALRTEGGGWWKFVFCDIDGYLASFGGRADGNNWQGSSKLYATRLFGERYLRVGGGTALVYGCYFASGGLVIGQNSTVLMRAPCIMDYKGVGNPSFHCTNGGVFILYGPADYGVFGFADAHDRAMACQQNGMIILQNYVYGYDNTFDHAMHAIRGGHIYYNESKPPLVAGATVSDTLVGSLERDYDELPATDLNDLSNISLR